MGHWYMSKIIGIVAIKMSQKITRVQYSHLQEIMWTSSWKTSEKDRSASSYWGNHWEKIQLYQATTSISLQGTKNEIV